MSDHLEKRGTNFLAVLTIPKDVRPALGKLRFVQSTQTSNRATAKLRAAILVAGWKEEIKKARGTLPNAKDDYWSALRKNYIQAQEAGDDGVQFAIQDEAKKASAKLADREKASVLYRVATNQATPLAPLVKTWKEHLRLAPKTIDQQHRDVLGMLEQFHNLEDLQPQAVKAWTKKLLESGSTESSLERIAGSCRSLWRYLRDSETVPVDAPDPFAGSFKLARKVAPSNTVGRQPFTAAEVSKLIQAAAQAGDQDLANLILLGAYTGARIEELCSLTVSDCAGGMLTIKASKTGAGVRQVPIHSLIKPLVASMGEAATDTYLVPSSAAGKYGIRSDPLSKRFGKLKESLEFGKAHSFHSIRKTVATLLEQAGVPEGVAADILGHEKKTMTYGLYSGGSSIQAKRDALEKVRYPD
ncbi:tyrosine-type recombinase/integrase [Paucibacter sp. Y2R2-4]|uniref:tyrosine-type recombinase/integrase n=1 Tax=Paucibacter sp. Y2R2-4 TaxID=2893553 RepID=UPI0021E3DDF2|nr:tyrosine-type recombinase/integrase [Paucibacter sp. Y2R2-4]MCV2351994.1 tyrosine-type recombinase/integrase [Paucibacter sp. Y2R2-4]